MKVSFKKTVVEIFSLLYVAVITIPLIFLDFIFKLLHRNNDEITKE